MPVSSACRLHRQTDRQTDRQTESPLLDNLRFAGRAACMSSGLEAGAAVPSRIHSAHPGYVGGGLAIGKER
jgi:hypothetical protein